jgi:acyl-coenzyme A thioesterase PaaI-like protein
MPWERKYINYSVNLSSFSQTILTVVINSYFSTKLGKVKQRVVKKQHISKMCFVCGENNDFGLHAAFYETDVNELVAVIIPSEKHQGYPGRMHGGIAATILDETIARSICIGKDEQIWGVTIELKTRFRKPVPLGLELKVVGRVTSEGSRSFEGTGEIILPNGEIAVTAEGKYMKMKIDKIADDQSLNDDWFFAAGLNDPSEIDIP